MIRATLQAAALGSIAAGLCLGALPACSPALRGPASGAASPTGTRAPGGDAAPDAFDASYPSEHFVVTGRRASLSAAAAERLLRTLESAYRDVGALLDRRFAPGVRLHVNVSERHSSPYASAPGPGAFVLVPLEAVHEAYGFSVAHELTHMLMGPSALARQPVTIKGATLPGGNRLLDEGLAVYVEERLRGTGVFPNFGVETHRAYLALRQQLGATAWPILETEYYRRRSTSPAQMRLAYLAQGSFCKFLVEQHGFARLLQGFGQDVAGIEAAYGRALADLQQAWQGHLAALHP